jgi:hypothetical protein
MRTKSGIEAIVIALFCLALYVSCGGGGDGDVVCTDADEDGYYAEMNCGTIIDCDDTDPNNWIRCLTCSDSDSDSYYAMCDAYQTIQGPDCDDSEASIYPGAKPIWCDGIDQDCDGLDVCPGDEPDYVWTRRIGGSTIDAATSGVIDRFGNIYLTGGFKGIVDFAEDFGQSDVKTSAGNYDIFVTKINSDGAYGWTHMMGGDYVDAGQDIAVDSSGNIYITGVSSSNTVDFAEDFGSSDVIMPFSRRFLTRINADGSYAWTLVDGGMAGRRVTVDDQGNIYVTTDNWYITISVIDPEGSLIWDRYIYGGIFDYPNGIILDESRNIYLIGDFEYSIDFAQDFGLSDPKTPKGEWDIFITRINQDTSYGWTRRIGGIYYDEGTSIANDVNGNLYLTGHVCGNTVDFGEDFGVSDVKVSKGTWDIFVTKIDTNASYLWTRSIGGTSSDYGEDIAVDLAGNVYVTGSFMDTVDFAEEFGATDVKICEGVGSCYGDAFVTRINADGSYAWTRAIGGQDGDVGKSIFLDWMGNIYVVGRFRDTLDFGKDFGASDVKNSAGSWDTFITKIAQPTP